MNLFCVHTVNAADNKQRDRNMSMIKIVIDPYVINTQINHEYKIVWWALIRALVPLLLKW